MSSKQLQVPPPSPPSHVRAIPKDIVGFEVSKGGALSTAISTPRSLPSIARAATKTRVTDKVGQGDTHVDANRVADDGGDDDGDSFEPGVELIYDQDDDDGDGGPVASKSGPTNDINTNERGHGREHERSTKEKEGRADKNDGRGDDSRNNNNGEDGNNSNEYHRKESDDDDVNDFVISDEMEISASGSIDLEIKSNEHDSALDAYCDTPTLLAHPHRDEGSVYAKQNRTYDGDVAEFAREITAAVIAAADSKALPPPPTPQQRAAPYYAMPAPPTPSQHPIWANGEAQERQQHRLQEQQHHHHYQYQQKTAIHAPAVTQSNGVGAIHSSTTPVATPSSMPPLTSPMPSQSPLSKSPLPFPLTQPHSQQATHSKNDLSTATKPTFATTATISPATNAFGQRILATHDGASRVLSQQQLQQQQQQHQQQQRQRQETDRRPLPSTQPLGYENPIVDDATLQSRLPVVVVTNQSRSRDTRQYPSISAPAAHHASPQSQAYSYQQQQRQQQLRLPNHQQTAVNPIAYQPAQQIALPPSVHPLQLQQYYQHQQQQQHQQHQKNQQSYYQQQQRVLNEATATIENGHHQLAVMPNPTAASTFSGHDATLRHQDAKAVSKRVIVRDDYHGTGASVSHRENVSAVSLDREARASQTARDAVKSPPIMVDDIGWPLTPSSSSSTTASFVFLPHQETGHRSSSSAVGPSSISSSSRPMSRSLAPVHAPSATAAKPVIHGRFYVPLYGTESKRYLEMQREKERRAASAATVEALHAKREDEKENSKSVASNAPFALPSTAPNNGMTAATSKPERESDNEQNRARKEATAHASFVAANGTVDARNNKVRTDPNARTKDAVRNETEAEPKKTKRDTVVSGEAKSIKATRPPAEPTTTTTAAHIGTIAAAETRFGRVDINQTPWPSSASDPEETRHARRSSGNAVDKRRSALSSVMELRRGDALGVQFIPPTAISSRRYRTNHQDDASAQTSHDVAREEAHETTTNTNTATTTTTTTTTTAETGISVDTSANATTRTETRMGTGTEATATNDSAGEREPQNKIDLIDESALDDEDKGVLRELREMYEDTARNRANVGTLLQQLQAVPGFDAIDFDIVVREYESLGIKMEEIDAEYNAQLENVAARMNPIRDSIRSRYEFLDLIDQNSDVFFANPALQAHFFNRQVKIARQYLEVREEIAQKGIKNLQRLRASFGAYPVDTTNANEFDATERAPLVRQINSIHPATEQPVPPSLHAGGISTLSTVLREPTNFLYHQPAPSMVTMTTATTATTPAISQTASHRGGPVPIFQQYPHH